ncbi:hypothetical protein AB0M44_48500 [Streptosporangium subroseum]|uniref:hypothetical protein n=1 Tax=Streptosporangium subroseum TaxID=106412 RepID=UPI0034480EA5
MFFHERFQLVWYTTGKTCFGMCEKNGGARCGGRIVVETVGQERTNVVEPGGEESIFRPDVTRTFEPSTPFEACDAFQDLVRLAMERADISPIYHR